MPTITQKEYKNIILRQDKIEEELDILKKIMKTEIGEEQIRPVVLKRWERISRDLDQGKGRRFSSLGEMRRWLKNL